MPRRIIVEFGDTFPYGLFAVSEVTPARDFEKSTKTNAVQTIDEDSGQPVWTLDVMDGDPEARKADRTFTVRIISSVQPVLPPALPGLPFTAIELQGMTASPWVDTRGCSAPDEGRSHRCRARQGWSFRCMGIRAPKNMPGSRATEQKAA
ncbi:plasmid replication, integration and excision activator [Kribbella italica]|uniref:Plasmid replication, integration and excision activator n=1 Tax=Kribbella italica TaxID=1540520 RepID=A0A7W9MXN6_9ACTN|nr:plasmid replication, integration and excision activator [Kribbella italica]MBB5839550.1 hypothetical protein [Kribbella italica]